MSYDTIMLHRSKQSKNRPGGIVHTLFIHSLTLLRFHAVYADLAEFCAYDAVCTTEVDVPRGRYRHATAGKE